jgi:hypothetical protein
MLPPGSLAVITVVPIRQPEGTCARLVHKRQAPVPVTGACLFALLLPGLMQHPLLPRWQRPTVELVRLAALGVMRATQDPPHPVLPPELQLPFAARAPAPDVVSVLTWG